MNDSMMFFTIMGIYVFFIVGFSLLFFFLGRMVAKSFNLSHPVIWGTVCVFTGIIGLLILLIIGCITRDRFTFCHCHNDNKKKGGKR